MRRGLKRIVGALRGAVGLCPTWHGSLVRRRGPGPDGRMGFECLDCFTFLPLSDELLERSAIALRMARQQRRLVAHRRARRASRDVAELERLYQLSPVSPARKKDERHG